MLISYNWLKECVDLTNITPEALADKMSRTGIEVEDVIYPMAGLKKIVVGEVKECVDHPNSDHLHICQVNIGEEVTQIVCGAPNVSAGQKVIVALPGARIVDNVKIKKGKMRGEASNGMLCALDEIGIDPKLTPEKYADGIYILPSDAIPGESVFPYLGMDDALLDLAITPNRADALSIRGASYEVAAIYHRDVAFEPVELDQTKMSDKQTNANVTIEAKEVVPTYMTCRVDHIVIQDSPQWMQNRLMNAGIRPVNNVVDITNYIMLEYGQPLHAYDQETIDDVVVRFANDKETMTTLDGKERALNEEDIVITSNNQVIALAGVMGALNSEVTEKTTSIVLESAIFDGVHIRRTSQRHNLRTDASSRFEKGIDQSIQEEALYAACMLLQRYANAEVCTPYIATKKDVQFVEVTTSIDRVNQLLGSELTQTELENIFAALQFPVVFKENEFTVTIPPRRFDIHIEADIIEEIIRIYGYEKLKATLPSGQATVGGLTETQQLERRIRRMLEACGMQEVISYALLTKEEAEAFAIHDGDVVALDLPMSQEHAYLRRSMISGLLNDIQYNVARKNSDLAFYEVGTCFTKQEGLPKEELHLGLAMTGYRGQKTWNQEPVKVDFFTLKGMMEDVFERLALTTKVQFKATKEYALMHPGRCAQMIVDDQVIGYIGQITPQYTHDKDLDDVYVVELNLTSLLEQKRQGIEFKEVSKYPAVTRDIALLLNKMVTNAQVMTTIKQAGGRFLEEVTLFDLYEGENIAKNQKSMGYKLVFVNREATLTDEEIEKAMQKIIVALEEECQATIR